LSKEPDIIHVEHPGHGFFEQVEVGEQYKYAVYLPKVDLRPEEKVEYSDFFTGEPEGDKEVIYRPLKKCPWPLAGEPEEPGDLWNDVRSFIYDHLDLPDDRLYDVMMAWTMATWIPEAWAVIPYLFFHGPSQAVRPEASKC